MGTKTRNASSKKHVRKLPGFFSLSNKKFVVALVIFVAVAGLGSFKLYERSSAATSKTVALCKGTTLRSGSRGECVKVVQEISNAATFLLPDTHWDGIAVDGIYGPITKDRVMQLQKYHNRVFYNYPALAVDGIVGPKTWDGLDRLCGTIFRANGSRHIAACRR